VLTGFEMQMNLFLEGPATSCHGEAVKRFFTIVKIG
jgi:hypothetical protein